MTVDLVVNMCLILFISSNLAILYMSNIGYVLCNVFALSGFLLLRKDRPNWPRPFRVSGVWLGIVRSCCCATASRSWSSGPARRHSNGYGTWTDFSIGVGVLAASMLLFFYRRIVEDKEKVHWKEETPTMPEGADRDALIQAGWTPTETPAGAVPAAVKLDSGGDR